ncbi:MAG TPA: ABC transporter permease [Streptosporangiaceae bacterium]
MNLWEYIQSRQELLEFEFLQHASMIFQCLVVATVVGVAVGVATYRYPPIATFATSTAGVIFTIPALALLGLLIVPLGLGVAPTVTALVLYGLLPIVRNTIVGLQGVDRVLVDAARGIGMSRPRILLRVELPMAWPVILTGIRVSTQLTMGIGAIAAYASGPGLGDQIFSGLSRIGGAGALESVIAGILGVVVLALIFDAVFVLIGRFTTSRGIRV